MKSITLVGFILISLGTNAQIPILDARKEINKLIDDWHVAAAEANAEQYFGSMTETSRFLGTDPSERWTKAEFMTFAQDAFSHGRTWDFTPSERKLTVERGLEFAWFDENLDTWMGPCRGSGVLVKTDDGWKIEQYNLAILIPNHKVTEYLDLIGIEHD